MCEEPRLRFFQPCLMRVIIQCGGGCRLPGNSRPRKEAFFWRVGPRNKETLSVCISRRPDLQHLCVVRLQETDQPPMSSSIILSTASFVTGPV